MPHCPYLAKRNGLPLMWRGLANRPGWSVFFSLLQSMGVSWNLFKAGLGSNVSIWPTPPSMVRKMQLRALAGWWGGLGARGLSSAAGSSRPSSSIRAMLPTPVKLW